MTHNHNMTNKSAKQVDVDEREQLYKDSSQVPSYGSKSNEHGRSFQLNMLMLILWRTRTCDWKNFRLSTEFEEAEKCDDVVFQYQDSSGKWKLRLIQAKHKESFAKDDTIEEITEKALLAESKNDPFALFKYFQSFMRIKQRLECDSVHVTFFGSTVEDLVLVTNAGLDSKMVKFVKKFLQFLK